MLVHHKIAAFLHCSSTFGPYAHITLTISSPNIRTIDSLTSSSNFHNSFTQLFLFRNSNFIHSGVIFTTPQLMSLFFYTRKSSSLFSSPNCLNTAHIHLLFLGSSLTSVPILHILPTFEHPNRNPNSEIFLTPCPFKGYRRLGANCFFSVMRFFLLEHFVFMRSMLLLTPNSSLRLEWSTCFYRCSPL